MGKLVATTSRSPYGELVKHFDSLSGAKIWVDSSSGSCESTKRQSQSSCRLPRKTKSPLTRLPRVLPRLTNSTENGSTIPPDPMVNTRRPPPTLNSESTCPTSSSRHLTRPSKSQLTGSSPTTTPHDCRLEKIEVLVSLFFSHSQPLPFLAGSFRKLMCNFTSIYLSQNFSFR